MRRFLRDFTGKSGYQMYIEDHVRKYGNEPQHAVIANWDYIGMPLIQFLGISSSEFDKGIRYSAKLMSAADGAYSIHLDDGIVYEVWERDDGFGGSYRIVRIDPENAPAYVAWQPPMPYAIYACG